MPSFPRLMLLLVLATTATANPRGGAVAVGSINISSAGKTLTIRQSTVQGIINWQTFENTASETIAFQQPSASSVTLNRVVGPNPSLIGGNLTANGSVFLINPNGVVFGPKAQVNVNSLVTSTLNLSDSDFLRKKYVFDQDTTKELSSIVNQGHIQTAPGGTVALVAPIVDNAGVINAPGGRVLLHAKTHDVIDTPETNFRAEKANGRAVRMAAIGLTPTLQTVVNTSSLASADKVEVRDDGTVFLRGAGGIAVNEGTIRTDATLVRPAGTVEIMADLDLALASGSRITANGTNARVGTGNVQLHATSRNLYYTGPSSPDPATRATAEGGNVLAAAYKQLVSTPDGSLEFKGPQVRLAADQIGTAAAPVQVRTDNLRATAEKSIYVLGDGDVTVGLVRSFDDVTVKATGSILSGPMPLGGGVSLPDGAVPDYVNIVSFGAITLQAGGTIGSPSRHLSIYQLATNPAPPTGPFIDQSVQPNVVAPGIPVTVSLVPSDPGARPTYTPPGDPSGTGLTSSTGSTIGGRDNVLVSSLRASLVKSEEEVPEDGGGIITVARRDDLSPEDEKLAKKKGGVAVARARR
jgi:filamentous hemagglutinin family protein